MKIKDILVAQSSLEKIAGEKFPAKVSYSISKIIRQVNPYIIQYSETINKLIKDNGKFDAEKNNYTSLPEKREQIYTEVKELENMDIDDDFWKINLSDIIDKITAIDINNLAPFVIDDMETKAKVKKEK